VLAEVFVVSLAAGCATGIGALPALVTDSVSHKTYDTALGFAGGVMVGASVFALILPGLDTGTTVEVMAGTAVGAVALLGINAALPHLHLIFEGEHSHPIHTEDTTEKPPEEVEEAEIIDDAKRKAALIAGAITIHNFPEGLAIGIAFGGGFDQIGLALAVAIAVQNVPDGFAMAAPAKRAGLSNVKTLFYTTVSGGIPEPVAAVLGFALVSVVTEIFPLAAGFAAGVMMTVVFREIVPSSHGHGYADYSTLSFVGGFLVMLYVDTAFVVA